VQEAKRFAGTSILDTRAGGNVNKKLGPKRRAGIWRGRKKEAIVINAYGVSENDSLNSWSCGDLEGLSLTRSRFGQTTQVYEEENLGPDKDGIPEVKTNLVKRGESLRPGGCRTK